MQGIEAACFSCAQTGPNICLLSFYLVPQNFLMKLGSCIHSCICANIALRRDLFLKFKASESAGSTNPASGELRTSYALQAYGTFEPRKSSFWKHKPRWYRIWTAISNSNAIRICKLLPEHSAWHEQTTRNIGWSWLPMESMGSIPILLLQATSWKTPVAWYLNIRNLRFWNPECPRSGWSRAAKQMFSRIEK